RIRAGRTPGLVAVEATAQGRKAVSTFWQNDGRTWGPTLASTGSAPWLEGLARWQERLPDLVEEDVPPSPAVAAAPEGPPTASTAAVAQKERAREVDRRDGASGSLRPLATGPWLRARGTFVDQTFAYRAEPNG